MGNQPPPWDARQRSPKYTAPVEVRRAIDPDTGRPFGKITLTQKLKLKTMNALIRPFLTKWLPRQLLKVLSVAAAATGGLLTMLAEAGSGTLAGGAHMEAFELLARREAVMVSECLQDQMDQLMLERWFPGLPQYAYFELAGAEENDPDKVVEHAVKLKGAGWTMKTEQLAEKTGYDFEAGIPPGRGRNPGNGPFQSETWTDQQLAADAVKRRREFLTENEGRPGASAAPLPALMNRAAPDALPAPVDGPEMEARKALAGALHEDFEGIRQQLLALMEMDPEAPGYRAALEAAQAAVDQLAGAAPGTLAADKAFESLIAAGLLEGWGLDDTGHAVAPDA